MSTEATSKNCIENDTTYNGWKNRETWALNLWFNNDQGLYLKMNEFIEECETEGLSKEDAVWKLVDFFKDHVEEEVDKISNPLIRDMIAFDVDYKAVAEANLEDYEEVE